MDSSKKRLDGRVVTMDPKGTVLRRGSVYIDKTDIVAVQDAGASPPSGFETVPAISTGGMIFPGLIDLHSHLSYNALPLWNVPKKFTNRGRCADHPEYRQLVTGPMAALGHSSDPKILPSIARYAEAKCLVAGVTTTQGIALASASGVEKYYKGLVRNVETPGDKNLAAAETHIADVTASDWKKFDAEIKKAKRRLLHLAEGAQSDRTAHSHFLALNSGGTWAISSSLVGIHCAALQKDDFKTFADHDGAMVWSPLSNYLLYGTTADVGSAKSAKVKIGLGPDWSPTGSKNLLGELKAAHAASKVLGKVFSDEELVRMVTSVAAVILSWSGRAGSVEKQKVADLVVVGREPAIGKEYEALVKAHETDISLVLIGGVARYGLPALMKAAGVSGGETLKVGGTERLANWDDAQSDPLIEKIDLGEATSTLKTALAELPNLQAKNAKELAVNSAQPGVRLALDEQEAHGFAVRPHLPMQGSPTGMYEGKQAALAPLPLLPVVLDRLTVADDPDYKTALQGEQNLPDDFKTALLEML